MVRVGMVGCGGISRMYCDLYAELVDIARVVAVADPVTELAEHRAAALQEAYAAEAHAARYAALNPALTWRANGCSSGRRSPPRRRRRRSLATATTSICCGRRRWTRWSC